MPLASKISPLLALTYTLIRIDYLIKFMCMFIFMPDNLVVWMEHHVPIDNFVL